MPPAGFEPTIPASERPQTHAFERAATGIAPPIISEVIFISHNRDPEYCLLSEERNGVQSEGTHNNF
jgi:hypothetical protein